VADAYVTALTFLARRELSTAQVRGRLARRQFDPHDIEAAVTRLQAERALDDRRAALACARREAHFKRHGQARALRQLEMLGIDREVARAAVTEVFADLDEDLLIEQALDRRLRTGASLPEAPALRRAHRYLLAQGFDAARVHAAIRSRIRNASHDD
jgi:SOS response regulatory protein OraA/RecX